MKIFLHGYLQDLHPEPITIQASTVAEAISSLQLIPALVPAPGQPRHSVAVDGFGSQDALYDRTDVAEIHIRPVMVGAGSGNNGIMQIVIGVVMIAVAVFAPELLPAFMGPNAAAMVGMSGAMMVLGGVMAMLAPQPSLGAIGSEDERSKFLGQAKNTVAIGTRIPIILGRHKWGGHFISFDIDAGDLNSAPATWYESPFTDYTNGAAAPAIVPMASPAVMDNAPSATVTKSGSIADQTGYLQFTPLLPLEPGMWTANLSNGVKFACFSTESPNNLVYADGTLPAGNLVGLSVNFTKTYDT